MLVGFRCVGLLGFCLNLFFCFVVLENELFVFVVYVLNGIVIWKLVVVGVCLVMYLFEEEVCGNYGLISMFEYVEDVFCKRVVVIFWFIGDYFIVVFGVDGLMVW